MYKSSYIKFVTICIFILLCVSIGYAGWKRVSHKSEISEDKKSYIDNWKTFFNREVGISFLHPGSYCVGAFTRGQLIDLGHTSDPSLEGFIRIADSRETDCLAPFEPGLDDIFQIEVFANEKGVPLEEWLMEQENKYDPNREIPEFQLPPITVDSTTALRALSGEGTSNRGATFYNIWFQKGNLIVSITSAVNCTAKDGSCRLPRDEQFIAHIDTMIRTIRLSR
jgi:hypothetical protein